MGDRVATIIYVEIDSSNPGVDLDTILENGAAVRGYSVEEIVVSEATADKAFKLTKI